MVSCFQAVKADTSGIVLQAEEFFKRTKDTVASSRNQERASDTEVLLT